MFLDGLQVNSQVVIKRVGHGIYRLEVTVLVHAGFILIAVLIEEEHTDGLTSGLVNAQLFISVEVGIIQGNGGAVTVNCVLLAIAHIPCRRSFIPFASSLIQYQVRKRLQVCFYHFRCGFALDEADVVDLHVAQAVVVGLQFNACDVLATFLEVALRIIDVILRVARPCVDVFRLVPHDGAPHQVVVTVLVGHVHIDFDSGHFCEVHITQVDMQATVTGVVLRHDARLRVDAQLAACGHDVRIDVSLALFVERQFERSVRVNHFRILHYSELRHVGCRVEGGSLDGNQLGRAELLLDGLQVHGGIFLAYGQSRVGSRVHREVVVGFRRSASHELVALVVEEEHAHGVACRLIDAQLVIFAQVGIEHGHCAATAIDCRCVAVQSPVGVALVPSVAFLHHVRNILQVHDFGILGLHEADGSNLHLAHDVVVGLQLDAGHMLAAGLEVRIVDVILAIARPIIDFFRLAADAGAPEEVGVSFAIHIHVHLDGHHFGKVRVAQVNKNLGIARVVLRQQACFRVKRHARHLHVFRINVCLARLVERQLNREDDFRHFHCLGGTSQVSCERSYVCSLFGLAECGLSVGRLQHVTIGGICRGRIYTRQCAIGQICTFSGGNRHALGRKFICSLFGIDQNRLVGFHQSCFRVFHFVFVHGHVVGIEHVVVQVGSERQHQRCPSAVTYIKVCVCILNLDFERCTERFAGRQHQVGAGVCAIGTLHHHVLRVGQLRSIIHDEQAVGVGGFKFRRSCQTGSVNDSGIGIGKGGLCSASQISFTGNDIIRNRIVLNQQ